MRRVDDLLRAGLAARARLTREEVIAVVLYSGPMVTPRYPAHHSFARCGAEPEAPLCPVVAPHHPARPGPRPTPAHGTGPWPRVPRRQLIHHLPTGPGSRARTTPRPDGPAQHGPMPLVPWPSPFHFTPPPAPLPRAAHPPPPFPLQFAVYDAVLRCFPAHVYEAFKLGGNLFPTTVAVLASALHKIARASSRAPQPAAGGRGRRWYLGVGGVGELPAGLVWPDGQGARGVADPGFLSLSASKDVAARAAYAAAAAAAAAAGGGEGGGGAVVVEVGATGAGRGAAIAELSQYPEVGRAGRIGLGLGIEGVVNPALD